MSFTNLDQTILNSTAGSLSMTFSQPTSLVKCGVIVGEIPPIPNRIRALARVIQNADPYQFPDLHDHETGELREEPVVAILNDLGVVLSPEEQRVFPIALRECKRALWRATVYGRGSDQQHSPDSVVTGISKVLSLCNAIDTEAAFAGAALGSIPDAVLKAYIMFTHVAALETAFTTQSVLIQLYEKVVDPLQTMHTVIREHNIYATRKQAAFTAEERTEVAIANETLNFTVDHLAAILDALEKTQRSAFSVNNIFEDKFIRYIWSETFGDQTPAVLLSEAGPFFAYFPEWSRKTVAAFVDYYSHGILSVFGLQRALGIWGPGPILPYRIAVDIRRRTGFLLGKTPRAVLRHVEMNEEGRGAYAVTLASKRDGNEISVCVKTERKDSELKVRELKLVKKDGVFQIVGVSSTLNGLGGFESVSAAINAFPELFVTNVGSKFTTDFTSYEGDFSETTSMLHRAAFCCDIPLVKKLLSCGSEGVVNFPQQDDIISEGVDWTPLVYAACTPMQRAHECMQLLTQDSLSDVSFTDTFGRTALFYSVLNGHAEACAHLLMCKPDLMASVTTVSPLLVAIGAHWLHPDINDIHQFATVKISADVIEAILYNGGAANLTRDDLLLVIEILRIKEVGNDAMYARSWTSSRSTWKSLDYEHSTSSSSSMKKKNKGSDDDSSDSDSDSQRSADKQKDVLLAATTRAKNSNTNSDSNSNNGGGNGVLVNGKAITSPIEKSPTSPASPLIIRNDAARLNAVITVMTPGKKNAKTNQDGEEQEDEASKARQKTNIDGEAAEENEHVEGGAGGGRGIDIGSDNGNSEITLSPVSPPARATIVNQQRDDDDDDDEEGVHGEKAGLTRSPRRSAFSLFKERHHDRWKVHASLITPEQRERVVTSIVAHGAFMRKEPDGLAQLYRARRVVQGYLMFLSCQGNVVNSVINASILFRRGNRVIYNQLAEEGGNASAGAGSPRLVRTSSLIAEKHLTAMLNTPLTLSRRGSSFSEKMSQNESTNNNNNNNSNNNNKNGAKSQQQQQQQQQPQLHASSMMNNCYEDSQLEDAATAVVVTDPNAISTSPVAIGSTSASTTSKASPIPRAETATVPATAGSSQYSSFVLSNQGSAVHSHLPLARDETMNPGQPASLSGLSRHTSSNPLSRIPSVPSTVGGFGSF